MKNLSTKIENSFDKLDKRWRRVPLKTQRLVAILFFTVYALLSLYIVAKVCFDLGRASNELVIEHIDSVQSEQVPSQNIDTDNNAKN